MISHLSKTAQVAVGSVVALLSLSCTAQALQSVTTPNAAFYTFSLASGGLTPDYKPPVGVSVAVMANTNQPGNRGIGHMCLQAVTNNFVEWAGQNSPSNSTNNGTVTSGYSGVAGTRLLFIDYGESVQIEVGSVPHSIRIHNLGTYGSNVGTMTWSW